MADPNDEARAAREEPELTVGELLDDEDQALRGRLVQPDLGMVDADDTPEELGEAVPDVTALSAEEAAMRVVTDPEGLGGGMPGYLDEEVD